MIDEEKPTDPGDPRASRGRGIVRSLGVGLGCLFILVAGGVLFLVALAYFFNEPALGLGAIALVVAIAAYSSRGRRS